jgi:hypothetical protein
MLKVLFLNTGSLIVARIDGNFAQALVADTSFCPNTGNANNTKIIAASCTGNELNSLKDFRILFQLLSIFNATIM